MPASSPQLRRLRCLALVVALLGTTPAQAPQVPPEAAALIQGRELLEHATTLASADYAGRLTGSLGQVAAAEYVVEHLAELGLAPFGDEAESTRSFLQHYGIRRTFVAPESQLQFGDVTLQSGFAVAGAQTSGSMPFLMRSATC